MEHLFGCTISLHYRGSNKSVRLAGVIADKSVFRWDYKQPQIDSLFSSEIRLRQPFCNSNVCQPVPIDLNCLHALRRSTLGLDLYLGLTCRTFSLTQLLAMTWKQVLAQYGRSPAKAGENITVQAFRRQCRGELMKIKCAWPEFNAAPGRGRFILYRTPSQIPWSQAGRLRPNVRLIPPLPCLASLLVTAVPRVFPNRLPAPSFTRAFGCLQSFAWRLIRWVGASLPPERSRSPFGPSVNALPMPLRRGPALGSASSSPLSGLAVAASPG